MKAVTIALYGVIALVAVILSATIAGTATGYVPKVIEGNSMFPTLKDGQLIVVKPDKDVHEGDVILFTYNNGVILHRVVGVNTDDAGNVIGYETKGDNPELYKEARATMPADIEGTLWISAPRLFGLWEILMNFPVMFGLGGFSLLMIYTPWEKIGKRARRLRNFRPETAT